MYHRVGLLGVLCATGAAFAEPAPITGKSISETFTGASIILDTPLGTKLPVKYGANGLISGEAGGLAFFLGSATDRGRWWVADDKLCHKWFKWFDAEVQCLRLRRDGERLFWSRDDGKTGTATLIAAAPIEPAPYALGSPPSRQVAALPVEPPMEIARVDASGVDVPVVVSPKVTARPTPKPQAVTPKQAPVAEPDPKLNAQVLAAAKPAGPPPARIALAAVVPGTKSAVNPKRTSPEIKPLEQPIAAQAPLQPPPGCNVSFMVAGVHPDDVLHMRQGPSAETPAVGALAPRSQGVLLTGRCQQDWCPVTHRGITGWVNVNYLVEEKRGG